MNLYETALNGLGLGTKAEELDQMYKDHEGYELAQALIMNMQMALDDLKRAESQAAREARQLGEAMARFQANATVSNSEWLTTHANRVEKYTREAQTAYTRVGEAWRLWQLQTK